MFCPKCGKENADDAQFCISCGSALSQTAAAQPNAAPQPTPTPQPVQPPPGIVCPQCGSTNLTVTTETNVQTTGKNFSLGQACCGNMLMGPFGVLCGLCGQGQKTTSNNTTFWVCNNCGKKFKHFDEYEKQIQANHKSGKIFLIAGAVWLFFSVILLICTFSITMSAYGMSLGEIFSALSSEGNPIGGLLLPEVLLLVCPLVLFKGSYMVKKTEKALIAERDELKAQMDKFLQK